ncbi:AI-2E family transporter [Halococcus saccharolyticus]|uniref:Permease n=1 Tax=Halococcus saccharolyticus DSM 5350 TaxID=1227455 RepID=M0MMW7_9EURY|nr:AI-2E family transporter [Halococcus saccharolyticus]EMA46723.1 permease [Halococcus saccharolyticus DSM 5350]
MADLGSGPPTDRTRLGWWVFVIGLAAIAGYVAYSFIGMVVLGVFGYYATRPICRRLARRIDSDGIAAGATVLLVVVPILLLVAYAGFNVFQQLQGVVGASGGGAAGGFIDLGVLPPEQQETARTLLQNPTQVVSQPEQAAQTALTVGAQAFGAVAGGLVLVGLALTLSYFLLQNDDQLAGGLEELFGGRETVAYAYAAAVDEDLESVFFGNLLFVITMAVIAAIAYEATNLLAPGSLHVPMVLVLAVLTGFTSLIPIVVGKVIYLPVVAYLGVQALQTGGGALVFVAAVLVVYFLVLDILPQTFLQPYITGRQLDMVVLMFAYLLGPILFGWYGFFLLPIVFIAILELVRIVLPELVRGEPLTPTVSLGEGVGTNPRSARDDVPGEDAADETPDTDEETDDPAGAG